MSTFRRTIAVAAATAGLLVSSSASAANPAAKLSVAPAAARAGAPVKGSSRIGASVSTTALISAAIIAAFAVIVLATTGDDSPDSP